MLNGIAAGQDRVTSMAKTGWDFLKCCIRKGKQEPRRFPHIEERKWIVCLITMGPKIALTRLLPRESLESISIYLLLCCFSFCWMSEQTLTLGRMAASCAHSVVMRSVAYLLFLSARRNHFLSEEMGVIVFGIGISAVLLNRLIEGQSLPFISWTGFSWIRTRVQKEGRVNY